jgi:hypothetical protein
MSSRAQLLSTNDETAWRAALSAQFNVFGSLEFACIVERFTDAKARLAVVERDETQIVYPLLLRDMAGLPFVAESSGGLRDSVTPEYTGPMARGSVRPDLAEHFKCVLDEMFVDERIVAEFVHPHPWHFSPELRHASRVEFNREIVYVDTTQTDQRLWDHSFNHACRKNLKRAEQKGVRIFAATERAHIEEFYRIYKLTMDRAQALQKYYFSLEYFFDFFHQLANHARFTLAEYDKQIIAATLYLHDDIDVYSYLGGADFDFQEVRPTNAVVYDTIRWARQAGKQRLILGGGYRPDDGIFRFKAGFSPMRAQFRLYKQIHLKDQYDGLCRKWSAYHKAANDVSFFPAYRASPPAPATGIELGSS